MSVDLPATLPDGTTELGCHLMIPHDMVSFKPTSRRNNFLSKLNGRTFDVSQHFIMTRYVVPPWWKFWDYPRTIRQTYRAEARFTLDYSPENIEKEVKLDYRENEGAIKLWFIGRGTVLILYFRLIDLGHKA